MCINGDILLDLILDLWNPWADHQLNNHIKIQTWSFWHTTKWYQVNQLTPSSNLQTISFSLLYTNNIQNATKFITCAGVQYTWEQGWLSGKSACLPPMTAAWLQFQPSAMCVNWVCCWFLPCSKGFGLSSLVPFLHISQHFQITIRPYWSNWNLILYGFLSKFCNLFRTNIAIQDGALIFQIIICCGLKFTCNNT